MWNRLVAFFRSGCASSSPESDGKAQVESAKPTQVHVNQPYLPPISEPVKVPNSRDEEPPVSASRITVEPAVDKKVSQVAARGERHGSVVKTNAGDVNKSALPSDQPEKAAKERRAAAGGEAVRDQMRKLAVGGPAATQDEKNAIYEVSDSEDEDLDGEGRGQTGWSKDQEITDAICDALKKNFVFKGIPESLLLEVVERMHGVCFKAGSVVLRQNAVPASSDCMYYLQLGEAEVQISGAVEQSSKGHGGEERQVVGHTVRIPQKPGWVFGDVALLFNSSRTASVVAKTNITVWALDRMLFLKFVMKHAQGARALRFLRKLPLLKGLSDNDLIRAASRMPQRVYQEGQALIKYGERGEELYLIRYGKVAVMRPDGKGGLVEAVVLGRGQFVGERAVINNKLRSADCVARGTVQVVVMKKRDFMDLDNPLMAWMLDYDAVSACLRFVPHLKGLKQEQMEQILDRFDARQEVANGHVLVNQGDVVDKMFVIKLGELSLLQDGQPVPEGSSFVHEASGFSFFGESALVQPFKCPYTVVVSSDTLQMLCLPKRQLDHFLGQDTGLDSVDAVLGALKKSQTLQRVVDTEWKQLIPQWQESSYNGGEVIVAASNGPSDRIYLIKTGEVVLVAADMALPGPSCYILSC
ncbi:hypothetical protein CEUSTIGMA_g11406.t1 [Chlamydomonas eustigma]|uniref:Cyclic nucleotide-binding domain-containing protein n=1 Tax=Chlamydomonas eustigma TaxID=1157962 RepID=A0A250XLK7_9CHLO|nr:hypothetical protein CEUSTIGMA_g11406.t1 [Chlamydomonas eustigma]|eukprot:GAX83981.1 hypothetical protein CEUSTIGMA_g11406.t1 [Chlamydomonas eustigma]